MELRVPDRRALLAAGSSVAAELRRSITPDSAALDRLSEALTVLDLRGWQPAQLVSRVVAAALRHRAFGDDAEATIWAAALATTRVNDLMLEMADREAIRPLITAVEGGRAGTEELEEWAKRHVLLPGQEGILCPPRLVRAVLATARTGHPRPALNRLDELTAAADVFLTNKGLQVTDLALGEQYPRSPAQSYAHDRRAAETCDLLVAFLHPPSIGVGMVIEMALRQYPVLVLVAAPGEPMPPLTAGMHTYAEVITAGDAQQLTEGLSDVVARRGRELIKHSERRLARPSRWGALQGTRALREALPAWLPLRRAQELLGEAGRSAAATLEELEAVSQAAAVQWSALSPGDSEALWLSRPEHQLLCSVGAAEGWPVDRLERVVLAVDEDRRVPADGEVARASVRLETPGDVLRYVTERGL